MHQPTDFHLDSHNANKLDLNERRLIDLMSKIRSGLPKLRTQQEKMRIVMSGWSVQDLQGGNIVVACFATGRQWLHTFPSPTGGDCMSKLAPVEMLQFKCLAVRAAWGSLDRHAPAATKPYWGKEKKVKSGIQNWLGPLQCIWEPWHPLAVVTHKVEGSTLIYIILLDHFSPVNNTSCIGKKEKS